MAKKSKWEEPIEIDEEAERLAETIPIKERLRTAKRIFKK